MFLLALFQAASGFVLWLVPHRGGGYQATFLWSVGAWASIHDWVAVALLVMVVAHLILHWKWIVHMTTTWWKVRRISIQYAVPACSAAC